MTKRKLSYWQVQLLRLFARSNYELHGGQWVHVVKGRLISVELRARPNWNTARSLKDRGLIEVFRTDEHVDQEGRKHYTPCWRSTELGRKTLAELLKKKGSL